MKIQCSCGAKYAIDITPGMPPVTFVCQKCGQDYSAFINDLIRKELGPSSAAPQQTAPAAPALSISRPAPAAPVAPAAPAASTPPAAPAPAAVPRLKINRGHAPEAAAAPQEQPGSKYCSRHRTELTTDQCQVCQKPICPQCIETFGPFCSPFCRNKVEGASMNAPVHVGQRYVKQREFWRKTGLISGVAGSIVFCLLAFWFWYSWIGSVPKVSFFVRWDDISHSGSSRFVGDQLVFLHGGTLARYDLKTKQKVWSLDLVTPQMVDDQLKQEDEISAEVQRRRGHATADELEIPSLRKKHARIDLEMALSLYGTGQNIWVKNDNNLVHYSWDSGDVVQTVTLTNAFTDLTEHSNQLWASGSPEGGSQVVTRVNMDDGGVQTVEYTNAPGKAEMAQNARQGHREQADGGLPLSPNSPARPLNPQRVQQQYQNMPFATRLALPALLANSEHNRQINNEVQQDDASDQERAQAMQAMQAQAQQFTDLRNFDIIPDGDNYIAFSSQMMEQHIVEREAMKAPPAKSIIDSGNLGTGNEDAAVNEQLNEMQRNNGNDKVEEDESRYQVAIRRLDSQQPDWIGEVIGPPQFIPLKSVNVLTAGKSVTVFDKSNKKLWTADLTYEVPNAGFGGFAETQFGEGPCVEHDGALYVFDQAVLSAFDLNSGSVLWRIPSVGIVGLFFDDNDNVYVNTTSGSPDDIKYSRQIDVGKQTEAVVLKVDAKTGKVLWSAKPGGYITYLSGDYIYTYQANDTGDTDETLSDAVPSANASYLRLIRINPSNGHTMWDHEEGRAPIDINFDRNNIAIVFKKEVEVLHFTSF